MLTQSQNMQTSKMSQKYTYPEILKLMEERRGYERGSEKYRPINKDIKNKCKIAHEDFLDMKCYEISQNYNPNSKV